jgi:hypothetical protein
MFTHGSPLLGTERLHTSQIEAVVANLSAALKSAALYVGCPTNLVSIRETTETGNEASFDTIRNKMIISVVLLQ